MFSQLFKPKWQHQDAEKRLSALQQLSPEHKKFNQIIATLCFDENQDVQQAAIARCTQLDTLQDLVKQQPNTQPWVSQRKAQLLDDLEPSQAATTVRTESDEALLTAVATQNETSDLRELAIRRLDVLKAEDALLAIATQSKHAYQRLFAAQHLQQPSSWRKLQKQSKDKKINQWAREKWRQHQDEQHVLHQKQEERSAVLSELKQHRNRTIDNLYEARLIQWQQQWEDNQEGISEAEAAEYAELQQQCQARLIEAKQQLEEQEKQQQIATSQLQTIDEYENILTQLQQTDWPNEMGNLGAALAIQERRWATLNEEHQANPTLNKQFNQLQEKWRILQDFMLRYLDFKKTTEQEDSDAEELKQQAQQLEQDWPKNLMVPELLNQYLPKPMATRPSAQKDKNAYAAKDDALFFRLRGALNHRNLRQANRLWQRFENEIQEQPNSQREQRFNSVKPRLDELRDWHNFAAEPKKEQLCERMEALAKEDMVPEEKANAIQALHQEWRELMSSDQDSDQALWERFKAASDEAYLPCKEHFKELDALRAEKLEERKALAQQMNDLITQINQEEAPNWIALFEIRRKAPQFYYAIEPVRYTDSRATDQQFSAALKQLDKLFKEATKAHEPLHQELIDAMQNALDNQQGAELINQAKTLQQQWRELPWLHPKNYRNFNKNFRKLVDAAFQKAREAREEAKAFHQQNKEHLAAKIAEFNDKLTSLSSNELKQEIATLRDLPCPPREKALAQQRNDAIAKAENILRLEPLKQQISLLREQIEQAPEAAASNDDSRLLTVAVETISNVESPAEDKELRFEWQLKRLPQMMTQGQVDSLSQLQSLFANSNQVLNDGLTTVEKERIQQALHAVVR